MYLQIVPMPNPLATLQQRMLDTLAALVEDEEELNARAYWQLGGGEHCSGCQARARRNPYVFRGGVLQ